ncbi:hypothetical protein DM01DRAFT_1336829 [Hesseltinella vesiculosa]|uniref:Uncharacterized protein n=1 Tax=Hesseltinella vesiculosa TaxID=101127 RepID=A0A1X2GFD4_9FUNG|nr:hypothetical protein DM01DRAFT_1336829 [Hesseltinella vesiculosa]
MTKGVAIGMISGLIEGKHMNKALMIYNRMKREGIDFIDTLIPYKLQQWEDTWAPTLSKAIYNKDYKIVNEELYVDPLDDKVKILVMLDPIPDVGWIHRDGMLEMDEHGEWKQVFQPWEEIDIHPGTSLTEFEHGIEYRIHDDKTTINIIKLYLDNPSMFMIEIDNYNTILRRGDEYGYLCNACMENIDNTNCTCTNMYKISICKHDIGNFGMAFRYYLGW